MRKLFYGLLSAAFLIFCFGTAHGGAPGALNWSYTATSPIYSSPTVGANGTIYVGGGGIMDVWENPTGGNDLYALNPDGSLKWSYATGDTIWSSPAIGGDGTIYVGSADNKLYAFKDSGSKGTLRWSYATGDSIFSSPAIGPDGTIYVGSYDGSLYAIKDSGAKGTRKWYYATEDSISSSPAIGSDGTVYVGSLDQKLYAIKPNGALKWSYATGDSIYSSPAIGVDGTIYVGSNDGKLYAIKDSGAQGTLKWSYTTGDSISSSPAIGSDGTIYVGSGDNKLYAIKDNGAQGTLKWSYATGAGVYSSPAIGADGTVYVGSSDHNLYAVKDSGAKGTRKWYYDTGDVIYSSPAIGADGTVYVGSYDSKLYSLYGSPPGQATPPWPMFHHGPTHTGAAPPPLLTVTQSGSGAVTSTPSGIDCGADCAAGYALNTKVTLTPVPESGSIFANWSGDCKGTGACVVTMSAWKSVEAVFEKGSCAYTISPKSNVFSYKGGTVAVAITAKGSTSCPAPGITISQQDDWISPVCKFAMTTGTVKLTVPAYNGSVKRTGTVTIGKDIFTITQDGQP